MKTIVSVLTYNAMSSLRMDLLEQTLRSLDEAFPDAERKIVFDNDSPDGSRDALADPDCPFTRDWEVVPLDGVNTTPGAGKNAMIRFLFESVLPHGDGNGIVVMSDDDMLWRPRAGEILDAFWSSKSVPADLAILCGLLEPEYPWNTPRSVIEVDGVRALVRDSAPGAAWTFTRLGPVGAEYDHRRGQRDDALLYGRKRMFIDDFGYDYEYCQTIQKALLHRRVAQIDLATHIGGESSTHGNLAHEDVRARPLDREKWRV